MSLLALLAAAGTLGGVGGVHCLAMCSGLQRIAVHGLSAPAIRIYARPVEPSRARRAHDGAFQLARVLAYTGLGAVVGSGSWLLRWGATAWPVMRPAWTALNVAVLLIGLSLLWQGRQPRWLDALGQTVAQALGQRGGLHAPQATRWLAWRPWLAGLAWACLPCGLLYSALALAALASDPIRGALVMLTFAVGTAGHLLWLPTLLETLTRLGPRLSAPRLEQLGMRVGGGLLTAMALAALLALSLGQAHPFCTR